MTLSRFPVAVVLLGIAGICLTGNSTGADPKPVDGWAFRAIKSPAVPNPSDKFKAWVRNPVDAFVLEKLLANGLRPSPEAARRVLARRVFLDLTGLPPTPDELDAYLKDTSANAYEKLVDKLLASPRDAAVGSRRQPGQGPSRRKTV